MTYPQNELLQQAFNFSKNLLEKELSDEFQYHNITHTIKVSESAELLGKDCGIDDEEMEILLLAAFFHDLGYVNYVDKHEEHSAVLAQSYLSGKNYPTEKIERVKSCILSTSMPQSPNNLLEKILCDADLSSIGDSKQFESSLRLRNEWELTGIKTFSNKEWYEMELEFFENHEFHTEAAKKMFLNQKNKNVDIIKAELERINAEEPAPEKKAKKKKKSAKSDSKKKNDLPKGVETMFRTASRSHINLSSIADNKANIMLSINALIISIVISGLVPKLDSNPYLTIPTLMLLAVCLIAIIFATLSTMPKITKGEFSREDIENKRSNLLFFGNFYNMKVEEYEWGMQEMMKDSDFLYGSLTRDLYYLGVVLAKKYRLLRICYGVFMFGLIAAVIAFGISFMFFSTAIS